MTVKRTLILWLLHVLELRLAEFADLGMVRVDFTDDLVVNLITFVGWRTSINED